MKARRVQPDSAEVGEFTYEGKFHPCFFVTHDNFTLHRYKDMLIFSAYNPEEDTTNLRICPIHGRGSLIDPKYGFDNFTFTGKSVVVFPRYKEYDAPVGTKPSKRWLLKFAKKFIDGGFENFKV